MLPLFFAAMRAFAIKRADGADFFRDASYAALPRAYTP